MARMIRGRKEVGLVSANMEKKFSNNGKAKERAALFICYIKTV
jgi:hypothetical protein